MSMKNSNDTIGNRTRDLPACSTVPQPTAPPRVPCWTCNPTNFPDTVSTVSRLLELLILRKYAEKINKTVTCRLEKSNKFTRIPPCNCLHRTPVDGPVS